MNPLRLLKGLLVFIAIFHFVFGLGLMISVDFQKAAITGYGGSLEWTTATTYFIRIIGSFAFVLGYLAWMASRDPIKHKVIIIGFIEFFILRNINRHVFAEELYTALGVSKSMNIMTSLFFGLQALVLAYLLWQSTAKKTNQLSNDA